MKFEFHPDALEEYKSAARYYEEHQPGLGSRFIAAVEHAIQHIREQPLSLLESNQGESEKHLIASFEKVLALLDLKSHEYEPHAG